MSGKPQKPVSRWLLIRLACLLGFVCLWMVVGSSLRSWKVERAITRFERSPSQTHADSLVGLLQSYTPTARQGSRILTLLRRPTITTRATYAAGRPVSVALERPYHLTYQDTLWRRDEIGTVEGGDRRVTRGVMRGGRPFMKVGTEDFPSVLYLRGLAADQAKPGIHQLTVRGAYSIGFRHRSEMAQRGHWAGDLLRKIGLSPGEGWLPDRTYECEFEMPFKVTVVPEDQADTVKLISSAQLGEAMANALQMGSSRRLGTRRKASGQIRYRTSEVIHYRDLPISAVFRLTLHLSDGWGRAISLEDPEPLVVKTGASGKRSFSYWFDKPDTDTGACTSTYTGAIALRPDPNRAYEDPAIKAIWNETLEFPISFTISE